LRLRFGALMTVLITMLLLDRREKAQKDLLDSQSAVQEQLLESQSNAQKDLLAQQTTEEQNREMKAVFLQQKITLFDEDGRSQEHIRFHDLRHSCASLLFAKGCSMRLVMEIPGHSQIAITANIHTHLLPEADREAARALDEVLSAQK
jgi:integrase